LLLLFLLSLAFLSLGILTELERRHEDVQPTGGSCPACNRPAEAEWLLCPHCRTLLKETCGSCGRQVSAWHSFCPDCGRQRCAEER